MSAATLASSSAHAAWPLLQRQQPQQERQRQWQQQDSGVRTPSRARAQQTLTRPGRPRASVSGARVVRTAPASASAWKPLSERLLRRRATACRAEPKEGSQGSGDDQQPPQHDSKEDEGNSGSESKGDAGKASENGAAPSTPSSSTAAEQTTPAMERLKVLARASDGLPLLPREVIEALRNQVFGFDTFFVTDQEPYEGGVLFRGNLRGTDSAKVYDKLSARLKAQFGDKYILYLLVAPDTERPVAVILPTSEVSPADPSVLEWVGASAFAVVSLLTTALAFAPVSPDADVIDDLIPSVSTLQEAFAASWPAALVVFAGLLAHEAGHQIIARGKSVRLGLPFLIPSLQLGSFGAVTRILSVVKSRADLIEVAAAGPLAGAAVSLTALLLSLALLHPAAGDGITLDASAFQDSLVVGLLSKAVLGDALVDGAQVTVSPVTLAAWSALLANVVNAIPAGELDGARVAVGLFGRQWAGRLSAVSFALLLITGLFNDIALFWFILLVVLQRGPVAPLADEVSPPSQQAQVLGVASLVMVLLVCCPLFTPF